MQKTCLHRVQYLSSSPNCLLFAAHCQHQCFKDKHYGNHQFIGINEIRQVLKIKQNPTEFLTDKYILEINEMINSQITKLNVIKKCYLKKLIDQVKKYQMKKSQMEIIKVKIQNGRFDLIKCKEFYSFYSQIKRYQQVSLQSSIGMMMKQLKDRISILSAKQFREKYEKPKIFFKKTQFKNHRFGQLSERNSEKSNQSLKISSQQSQQMLVCQQQIQIHKTKDYRTLNKKKKKLQSFISQQFYYKTKTTESQISQLKKNDIKSQKINLII